MSLQGRRYDRTIGDVSALLVSEPDPPRTAKGLVPRLSVPFSNRAGNIATANY